MTVIVKDTNGGEKPYEKVVDRLNKFRKELTTEKGYGLIVQVMYPKPVEALKVIFEAGVKGIDEVREYMKLADATKVRAKAEILHPDGRVLASGEAEKDRQDNGQIEATAEWVQTKAIGRCLAAANFGTGEISTADEILQELLNKRQIDAGENGSSSEPEKPAQSGSKPTSAGKSKSKSAPQKSGADKKLTQLLNSMGIDISKVQKNGIDISYDDKNKEVVVSGEQAVVASLKTYLGAKMKWTFKKGQWRKKVK